MGETTTIYGASELRRHSRAILAEARRGEAHVRDRDGVGLVLLPEQRVRTLRTNLRWAANLFAIERALGDRPPRRPDAQEYGEWAWLQAFDDDDLLEFVRELREALVMASREESPDLVEQTLGDWRVTAAAIGDPARRHVLLGWPAYEEFVEVTRPG